MPEVENKVKWCLNKARKELEKGTMHRGLVKVDPDLEEARKHVLKAEHNLKAAISFEKTGFSDWSASAAFYTIYHCFLAIARKFGYESRNQECTIALIESLKNEGFINIDQEMIDAVKNIKHEEKHEDSIIELRENFQYGTETVMKDEKLAELKTTCKKAIEETKKIIK
jgi:uncharacterized protein (UPF0332 family)